MDYGSIPPLRRYILYRQRLAGGQPLLMPHPVNIDILKRSGISGGETLDIDAVQHGQRGHVGTITGNNCRAFAQSMSRQAGIAGCSAQDGSVGDIVSGYVADDQVVRCVTVRQCFDSSRSVPKVWDAPVPHQSKSG